ncbi:MAG: hypothetical protein H0X46_06745 [Bacteroidetes bacterium]|nr:hypothetical protein [Bacteroidota bacterium]
MAKFKIPYRLIISVLAGIVISKILTVCAHLVQHKTGDFPGLTDPMFETPDLIASLYFHCVFAIVGAFFTAMIAKEEAKKAIFILGTKEVTFWLIGLIVLWNHAPFWFNISKAVIGPPLAWFGGMLYGFYKEKKKYQVSK